MKHRNDLNLSLRRTIYGSLGLGLALAYSAFPAGAAELLVPSQYPNIASAVGASVTGDVIVLADGTYSGPGNNSIVASGITIRSASGNPENCVLDMGGTSFGIAVAGEWAEPLTVSGITFQNAYTENFYGGGAIVFFEAGSVSRCIFKNNAVSHSGGAIATWTRNPVTISDCLFTGNRAEGIGGAIYFGGGHGNYVNTDIAIANCTVSANSARMGGGAVYCENLAARISNCVIWGNTAEYPVWGGVEVGVSYDHAPIFANCDVRGGIAYAALLGPAIDGAGNIDSDPLFVNPGAGDFRLQSNSPCRDTGLSGAVPTGIATDLDGKARIVGSSVDIGAYEFGVMDTDGDGIPDSLDDCPDSPPVGATIAIGGVTSGVANIMVSNGCTLADDIANIEAGSKNHGQFVSGIGALVKQLTAQGLLGKKSGDAVKAAAAKSNVPR